MKAQRGFTLVELMVSLVVFSFVVVGILAVAVSMANGYRDQRESTSNEGLVRVPMDYLGDALRQVSPAVPTFLISDASQSTCPSSAALKVVNSNPDTIEMTYAVGGVVTQTGGSVTFNSGTSVAVVSVTGLAANDWVVVSNLSQGHLFKIASITGNTLNFSANNCSAASMGLGYPPGSTVVRAQHAVFSIGTFDTSGVTGLLMTTNGVTEPLADNIEDMQVAVAIDADADGNITSNGSGPDDDEWVFNAADTAPSAWPPASPAIIRAVRISLVARSATTDVGNAQAFRRPLLEDRAQGGLDNYRRRVLKTTVEFRNAGVSP